MARCMQFDAQDRAALRKLDDDFTSATTVKLLQLQVK